MEGADKSEKGWAMGMDHHPQQAGPKILSLLNERKKVTISRVCALQSVLGSISSPSFPSSTGLYVLLESCIHTERNYLHYDSVLSHTISPFPNFYQLSPQVKYGVRSLKFIWAPVYSCTHWLRPRNSPSPLHLGAIGQPR